MDRIVQARIGTRLNELTRDVINEERTNLELIVSSLLERRTLTGQEIHDLLKIDEDAKLKIQERMSDTAYAAVEEAIETCKEARREEMRNFMMGQWRR